MQKLKEQTGITLIALVVTIIVLLILAGITIGLIFGPNGIINKAHEANENTKIEQVREQLELAKGPEYIEGEGKYNPDSYFQRIEDEEIIGNKKTDVKEIGEGKYEVTTAPGYIFIITLVPSKDNVEDIEIDYGGKVDGPRIREINVTNKTTSSISVEVETANAEGATYRYYYKKEGEEEWIKAGEGKENTYTFNGLEENKVYNIKVEVEKDGKVTEGETSSITGEMPKGAVQFSPVEWKNGKASTVITTSEEGYTLQYQIGGIAEGSWKDTTSGSTIGNLEYGVTVYGRLYDGTNGSKTASIDVEDKIKPTVVVTTGTITTNSIGVNVQVADNESGMKEEVTYTYYIKKSGEADSAYEAKATDITEASYTFTGLTQKTGYDIKVEVKEDKAGNVGIGKLLNKETGEVGGATGGLIEGNIIASTPTWSNGQASITLSKGTNVSSSLTIQYQVNGIAEGNWTSGTSVTGLKHNDIVYARLTDETNYGSYGSAEIKDDIAPTASISVTSVTANSVKVSVTASDGQSGLATTGTYKYYLNNETTPRGTSTTNSYTYTNLSGNTSYTLKVVVSDAAGNTKEVSKTTTTLSPYPTVTEKLKEGNYVNYVDKNGTTRKCAVLYDASSGYGLQIITIDAVENVEIGNGTGQTVSNTVKSYFNIARTSYNNAITNLNSRAAAYLNTTYASSARSVGSLPNNPNSESGYYENSKDYMQEYTGTLKNSDDNSSLDEDQLAATGLMQSNSTYWLASRHLSESYGGPGKYNVSFSIGIVEGGNAMWQVIGKVRYDSSVVSTSVKYGLRPVFTLKSTVRVVGGSGTSSAPYVLGLQ